MRISPWHKPGHVDRGHALSGVSCYGSGARVIVPDLPPQVCLYFEAVDAPKGRSRLQISMRLDEAHDLVRKIQNGITAHAELSASHGLAGPGTTQGDPR